MHCHFCLIPAGLFTFMVYAKVQTGDLLATFHTESLGLESQVHLLWTFVNLFPATSYNKSAIQLELLVA